MTTVQHELPQCGVCGSGKLFPRTTLGLPYRYRKVQLLLRGGVPVDVCGSCGAVSVLEKNANAFDAVVRAAYDQKKRDPVTRYYRSDFTVIESSKQSLRWLSAGTVVYSLSGLEVTRTRTKLADEKSKPSEILHGSGGHRRGTDHTPRLEGAA